MSAPAEGAPRVPRAATLDHLRGSITPLPTPFTADGAAVDAAALRALVEFQIAGGSHGVGCTGTTGEPTSLTLAERQAVIRAVVEAAAGRVPVLAGTGSNNTAESIALTRYAADVGADAVLVVAPYHVRPTQDGLFEHFRAVASAVELPVMLYNIPGRAGVNVLSETQRRVRAACPNVFGVKEANADFAQVSHDLAVCGRDWRVFSGIEALCFPMLALGGAGHVSATGNVAPRELAALYDLAAAGRWDEARDLHFRLLALNEVLFIETNPGPVKFLLGAMGLCQPTLRLPLAPPAPASAARIRAVAREYGLVP
ncbi:MAG TPA: 4-hydroxy-tetrahydrodipicolinate synthase [Candidatus Binatia bacterium]